MKKIVALALSLVMALALCTVAFAQPQGVTYYGAWTNQKVDAENSFEINMENVKYNKAVAPKTVDGETTPGHIAYYDIDDGDIESYFVAVDKLADADLVIATDDAMKNVYLYLAEVDAISYVNATVFTNFGEKCGQFNYANYDKDETYYSCEVGGDTLIVMADEDGERMVKVGDKFVTVEVIDELETVSHTAVAIIDKETGKVTGYKCNVCGVPAVKAANVASVPAGVQTVAADGTYYFAATATTTTETTTSPKTFDAGIAMYVGMSLMSVAGSAVVIGKKKEF